MLAPGALAQDDDELLRDSTMQGNPTTPTGEIIGPIYEKIIWASIAVFLLVAVLLTYIIIRFRHRKGEKREVPQIHGNSKLEIAWTIGPALVMFWLLVISYNGLIAIDIPEEEPELFIDVEASRFLWVFTYPDGSEAGGRTADGTGPVLRVQEDTWVQLNVTSTDVVHALAVPGLDVMIDANPGHVNKVQFKAYEPGVYLVQCRQFCGTGHGEMLAAVEVFEAGSQERAYGLAEEAPAAPPTGGEEPGVEPGALPPADVEIDMTAFDFGFDPVPVELEPGQTVRLRVINDGPSPHNLFVGEYDWQEFQGEPVCDPPAANGTGADDCWASATIGAGEETILQFTVPDEAIGYSLWCDISGHAQLGMLSYLAVGGEIPADAEAGIQEPRLPGPGPALVILGIVGLALIARRRM